MGLFLSCLSVCVCVCACVFVCLCGFCIRFVYLTVGAVEVICPPTDSLGTPMESPFAGTRRASCVSGLPLVVLQL